MHPGLDIIKWSELSDDDITAKISELQQKLGMSYGFGHGNNTVIRQINLLLDTYYNVQDARLADTYEKMLKTNDSQYDKQSIDIDWDYKNDETTEK